MNTIRGGRLTLGSKSAPLFVIAGQWVIVNTKAATGYEPVEVIA